MKVYIYFSLIENIITHWTRSPDRCSWTFARCGCMPPWWRCSWSHRWCIPWGSGSPGCGSGHDHVMMSEKWWTNGPLWHETMRHWSSPESPDPLLDSAGSRALMMKMIERKLLSVSASVSVHVTKTPVFASELKLYREQLTPEDVRRGSC